MDIKFNFEYKGKHYWTKSSLRIPIGLPINPFGPNNLCYYASNPSAEPITMGDFVGSVAEGGSVNYYKLSCTPHGNGTHTECVGHLTKDFISIWEVLEERFFLAQLITVTPNQVEEDKVVFSEQLEGKLRDEIEALVIRCTTTDISNFHNFSESNPPYLHVKTMEYMRDHGVAHLLFDQPSVDKEYDGGKLASHRAFWQQKDNATIKNTITELIRVPDQIEDGLYLLQIELSPIHMDAVPSMPYLYPLEH